MKKPSFGQLPSINSFECNLSTLFDLFGHLTKPLPKGCLEKAAMGKVYTEITGSTLLYPNLSLMPRGVTSVLENWYSEIFLLEVLLQDCFQLGDLSLGNTAKILEAAEDLFISIRAFGAYANPDGLSYSSVRAAPVVPYLEEQGLEGRYADSKRLAQAIMFLTRLPRATQVLGNFDRYPTIEGVRNLSGETERDRLSELLNQVRVARNQINNLRAINSRQTIEELHELGNYSSEERQTRPDRPYVYRPETGPTVKQTTDLVDEVLGADVLNFDSFYEKNKGRMSTEKFYGQLLKRVFDLGRKDRIVEGLTLLEASNLITAAEKDECLAMEGPPRSTKFREDYLFKLIKLAVKIHQIRCQIASAIGEPGEALTSLFDSK